MEHITSQENAKIKRIKKLVGDKKYRKQENLFICEGEKVFYEAIERKIEIDTLVVSEDIKIQVDFDIKNIISVPRHLFEKISDTKSPQGIMFACEMSSNKQYGDDFFEKLNRVIILDNLQDAGNMGTIIRTAVAFSIDAIIVLNNCVDHYSPKVVRSTMNAIFDIPVINMSVLECFEKIKLPIYATFLDKTSQNILNVDVKKSAVIIGNESKGVSKEVLKYANEKIIIPINNVQSLNASVASSIIMWEMSK